ncbi:MAG: hypothetical protein KAY37_09075, partial [Phycisphaerae bacterium]|nr:hypothetical protein [Phycisphaerae bacterium]
AALARAAELFDEPGPRHRQLLILSDLQETDWRAGDWPAPPHVVGAAMIRLNPPTEDNVVADRMVLSQGTAVAGQPNLLRVRLLNYRAENTPVEMVLRVDGEEHVRRPLELPGSSPHMERIPLIFTEPGEHRLSLSVDVRDALPADNTLFATVTVSPQLSVLVVDGQITSSVGAPSPSTDRHSAALYLRTALQALGSEGDSVRIDVVAPADLPGVVLDSQRVVILSAVRELPLPQVERLEQFVQTGGGLAVFLGPHARLDFYNTLLGGPHRPLGGLLPAELRDLLDTEGAEHPLRLVQADLDHPMLQRFKGTLRGALAGVDVYRAYAVVPREAWIVALLEQQLPLIVERGYGRGKVILFTTSPEPRWTNLPLRRLFLPLVSRLVSYLAGGGTGGAAQAVGEEIVLLRGGWDLDQPVYVVRPDGARLRAAVRVAGAEPLAVLPAEVVDRPGFYRLEFPSGSNNVAAGPRAGRPTGWKPVPHEDVAAGPRTGRPTGWKPVPHTGKMPVPHTGRMPVPHKTVRAVNTPRGESVPQLLDLDLAAQLAGNWRLEIVEAGGRAGGDDQTVATLLGGGPAGRGIWDTLLWTVLIFVLLEPLIANRIIGARTDEKAAKRRKVA